ncbi:mitochondrial ribosomal protein L32 [Dermatophagoides farinae]|uniref:mitochondrial ribosomal protein L32 n=1 Tax=Dermatophagoides farinae TaxID=6954 RepID=UPI003F5D98AA
MNQFFATAKNIFLTIKYCRLSLFNLDNFLNRAPPALVIVQSSLPNISNGGSPTSINDLMQDGLLWGVPKKRRTIEKRLKRRFGVENYPSDAKILRTRNDIIICERCGDHHEYYAICPTCYRKVKEETERMRDALREQTNPLQPKEKDVLFRFENEKYEQTSSSTSHHEEELKREFEIIDIDHPRPQWFSRNLMTKSTGSKNYDPKNVIIDPKDFITNNENNNKN